MCSVEDVWQATMASLRVPAPPLSHQVQQLQAGHQLVPHVKFGASHPQCLEHQYELIWTACRLMQFGTHPLDANGDAELMHGTCHALALHRKLLEEGAAARPVARVHAVQMTHETVSRVHAC